MNAIFVSKYSGSTQCNFIQMRRDQPEQQYYHTHTRTLPNEAKSVFPITRPTLEKSPNPRLVVYILHLKTIRKTLSIYCVFANVRGYFFHNLAYLREKEGNNTVQQNLG